MKDRVILSSINKEVGKINAKIVDRLPGKYKPHKSYDSVKDKEKGETEFTLEFFNSIETADLPKHELKQEPRAHMALVTRSEPKMRLGTRVIDFTVLCLLAIITKINLQIQCSSSSLSCSVL